MIFINITKYENIEDIINVNTEQYKDIIYLYSQALKTMEQKINIIKYDYEYQKEYDSIDHIMSRIKSPESILDKMKKDNLELTYKNMIKNINDIAGVRVICPFKNNIKTIREYIKEFTDIEVIKEKDYVTHPKESGYSSYHMIVKVPILIDKEESKMKVEIQIRSLAMDFWASLEHKIRYKPSNSINNNISNELVKCAKNINQLDNKMVRLFQK